MEEGAPGQLPQRTDSEPNDHLHQQASSNAFPASGPQPCNSKVRQCSSSQPQAESSNSALRRTSNYLQAKEGNDRQHAGRPQAHAGYQSFSCPPLQAAASSNQTEEHQGTSDQEAQSGSQGHSKYNKSFEYVSSALYKVKH